MIKEYLNNIKVIAVVIGIIIFAASGCTKNRADESGVEEGVSSVNEKTKVMDEKDHEEEGVHVVLSEKAIKLAGISIDSVELKKINKKVIFPGEIVLNEERRIRVIPRFPGIIKKVYKKTGEEVLKGDILAKIQSNESFTSYSIISEISGIVLRRNTAPGEFAGEGEVIFEIADLSTVWVRLHIFPKNIIHLKEGIKLKVSTIEGDRSSFCRISSIIPVYNRETRSMIARGILENRDKKWPPGAFINGEIVISSPSDVPVIYSESIRTLNDETIVFVPEENNEFHIVHIIVGRSNGTFTEIISGLKPGDKYVRKGTFELKAKIITSTLGGHAGHGH